MKKFFLITLTSLCFVVISCKKDQVQNFIGAEFGASSITVNGDLRVYTEGGQAVIDPNTIQNFTTGNQPMLRLDQNINANERVKFVSSDSVYFIGANGAVDQKYAYKLEGTKILFYQTHIQISGQVDSYIENLYQSIVKYQPLVSATQGSPSGFYYRTVTNISVGDLTAQQLKIYRFAFKYTTTYNDGSWRANGAILMNQFNTQFVKTLTSQNMLAIQDYVLNFKRVK